MEQLIQKRDGDFLRYNFGYDGLKVSTYIRELYQTYMYRYEDIEFGEIITERKPSMISVLLYVSVMLNFTLILIITSGFLISLAGSALILLVPGLPLTTMAILWGKTLFKKKYEKSLAGPMKITFFYNKKERHDVDEFIHELKKKQKQMMRKKYMRIDAYIPADEQEKRFCWLYDHEFITKSELEVLIEEIENLKLANRNKF